MAAPQVTLGGGIKAYQFTDANGKLIYVTADRGIRVISQDGDIIIKRADFADLVTALNTFYPTWSFS